MNHLVIDSNVFVSAFQTGEADNPACVQFLGRIRQVPTRVTCPTLVLPECAGAISRQTGDTELAEEAIATASECPGLRLLDLDEALAHSATDIAISCKLKGSDAVYAAVAQKVNAMLITLDRELLTRAVAIVPVSTPMQWIAGTRLPG